MLLLVHTLNGSERLIAVHTIFFIEPGTSDGSLIHFMDEGTLTVKESLAEIAKQANIVNTGNVSYLVLKTEGRFGNAWLAESFAGDGRGSLVTRNSNKEDATRFKDVDAALNKVAELGDGYEGKIMVVVEPC